MRIDLTVRNKESGKTELVLLYPDVHFCSILDLDGDGEALKPNTANREETEVLIRDLIGHEILAEKNVMGEIVTLAEGVLEDVQFDLLGDSTEIEP